MATPDEKKIIKIIEEFADEKGECREGRIIREMGLTRDYARVILQSMGMRDLIDYFMKPRRCRIANKGWQALGKRGTDPIGAWVKGFMEKMEQRMKKEREEEAKMGGKKDIGWRSEWQK